MRALFFLLPLIALAATDWGTLLDQNGGARVHFGSAIGGADGFARNADELLAPASTAKVLTAGALLAALGSSYRYPTELRWNEPAPGTASNVTVVGAGDPSWGLSELRVGLRDRFDELAKGLKAAGVRTVQGNPVAVAADPRWNQIRVPEGWKTSDTSGCGGALAQAFNLQLNCATLAVSSPTHAAWDTAGVSYPVRLAIRPGESNSLSARFTGSAFVVEGTWKGGTQRFSLPVFDTRPWAAALLKQALLAQGIAVLPGRVAGGDLKQLVFYSPPLSELLKPFLKNSINLMGDAFLKTLGAAGARDGDLLAAGLAGLSAFLRPFGDERDLLLHDGSGLSRTARVTPSLLLRYLERIPSEPWFPALYAGLPVAGVDGTLRNRMKGTAAEGRLRAKTGTLDGVYNLAGYVPAGAGRYVPFVILTRTSSDLSGTAKAAADRVGARLAATHADPSAAYEPVEPYPYVPEHAGFDAD